MAFNDSSKNNELSEKKNHYSLFGAMTDTNIWNRSLSKTEVEQWSRCEMEAGGNLLDWTTAQWEAVGLQEVELGLTEVCRKEKKNQMMVFHELRDFDASLKYCSNIGGEMAVAKDDISRKSMIEAFDEIKGDCEWLGTGYTYFYSGYTDKREEGVWIGANKRKMTNDYWRQDSPGSFNISNYDCALMSLHDGLMMDHVCLAQLCPICEIPEAVSFSLKGVCTDSFIDRFYVLKTNKNFLLGYTSTKMVYSETNQRWEIVNMITDSVMAFMDDETIVDLPLGMHQWNFTDDSGCKDQDGESDTRTLNFHLKVEQPGTFCCDDGACIGSEHVCDGNNHCDDRSDEKACQKFQKDSPYYNPNIPTPVELLDGVTKIFPKTKIGAKAEILKITEINEVESFVFVTLSLDLRWMDPQLSYNFLHNTESKNVFTKDDILWKPDIKFFETLEDGKLLNERFSAKKNGSALMTFSDDLRPNETYSGSENWLHRKIIYRAKFFCSFTNIGLYPFGAQNCSFSIFLPGSSNNLTDLFSEELKISTTATVGQYELQHWNIRRGKVIEDNVGLTFTVKLRRDLVNIFMVTYLPAFLMTMINQATNYISSPDKYELIITVNITCMMVLASIYLSVSNSLPSTAEIKPVEIWLLFSLLYPVLIVMVNILIQVQNINIIHSNIFAVSEGLKGNLPEER